MWGFSMPDIQKIIKALDRELERTGKSFLTPPEANKILERECILNDRDARSGLPLRKLLRQGKLPHAYQEGGKGSSWIIPNSSTNHSLTSNYSSPKSIKKTITKKNDTQETNFSDIKTKIEEARFVYKPHNIKYLLVGEAPPDSLDRFFYYSDVKTSDWLFLGVMQALYPSQKTQYLSGKRNSALKEKMLKQFQEDNFYLIDLLDYPLSFYSGNLSETTEELVKKIKELANENTQIILIKANVYDMAYQVLKEHGFKVVDKRIDFPGSGGQLKFQKKFREALIEAKYFN